MPQAACFEGLLAESALPFFLKSKFQGNRQEAARSFRLSSRSLRKSGPFWLSFWSLPHAIAFRFSSFLCETGGRVSVSPGHWVGGLRAERAAAAPGAEWNARRRTGRVGTGSRLYRATKMPWKDRIHFSWKNTGTSTNLCRIWSIQ